MIMVSLALSASLAATTLQACRRPVEELVPVERVTPRFPVDGPRAGYVRDGDLAVFDVEVGPDGRPRKILVSCSIGTPLMVRVSEAALRRSRFAPAAGPYRGQFAIAFNVRRDDAADARNGTPSFFPPPNVGDVARFQSCRAQPSSAATLTAVEQCRIAALRARCSPADDCLVTCIASTGARELGGGCEHVCFAGARFRDAPWHPPAGWLRCSAP